MILGKCQISRITGRYPGPGYLTFTINQNLPVVKFNSENHIS